MKICMSLSLVLVFFGFLKIANAEASEDPIALQKAAHDISRFYVVDAGKVYRGARPQPEDLRNLQLAGIKTILDLQGGDFDHLGDLAGIAEPGEMIDVMNQEKITSINLGMNWISERLSSFSMTYEEQIRLRRALKVISDPRMQPVFVHCEFGRDRTGLLAALYEVLFLGQSANSAHARWVATGHTGKFDRTATFALDYYFYKFILGLEN